MRQFPRLLFLASTIGLVGLALYPLIDATVARWQARHSVSEPRELAGTALLRVAPRNNALFSWSNIGGCGAGGGGASSTSGGAKWVGRNVRGGLLDLQCMGSQTFAADGALFTTVNSRVGTKLGDKWSLAVSVPLLYKRQDYELVDDVIGIAGFGDISLEVTRKLGITNTTSATLIVGTPVGSSDAARKGIELPQHLQLGSGVLSATAQLEHTADFDGGLMIVGGSFTYSGWENSMKDFRAPSLAAYVYVGYLLGPFVPAIGLNVSAKLGQDREGDRTEPDLEFRRSEALEDVPIGTVSPAVSVEWSSDWLALLLSASAPFSAGGMESFSLSLGVSTSLF